MSGGLRCCLNPGLVALQRRRRRRGTPGRSSRMVALAEVARRRGRWFAVARRRRGGRDAPAARRRRGTPVRSTLVEGGRGSPTRRRSSRVVALVGCATSRAAGARRGRWGYSSTRVVALVGCRGGLMEIVDIVNNFPGQAHRWLVDEGGGDCSTSTRAAEFPGWLVGDEGIKPHIVHFEMGDAAGDCEQVVCYTT